MASNRILVSETFINATKGHRFSEIPPYEPYTDNIGELYRAYVREYGRCIGSVNIDTDHGAQRIGWVFQKRMRYEDARSRRPEDYYILEVWVTLHEAPDTVVRTPHYREMGKVA